MDSRISRALLRLLTALALVAAVSLGVAAQDDPDPNSPTPVLLSEYDSTRALAQTKRGSRRIDPSRIPTGQAFERSSKVVIFVNNLDLMVDEGANAFRVYGQNKTGHLYRFPVVDIEHTQNSKTIYAVTIILTDEIGYWPQPEDGDLFIFLTWRGLASNTVMLGVEQTGGLKDMPGMKPTPLGSTSAKTASKDDGEGPSTEYVGYRWSGDRKRFLEQATFGPSPTLDSRLRRIGLKTWLAEQFSAPYPSPTNPYPTNATLPLKTSNFGADPTCDGTADDIPITCVRDSYSMYLPQTWFMREAFYGDAQLRHRVAWALLEIMVTSGIDVQQGRHMFEYHKILSNNAFGNFKTLMKEVTLNPAMGTYLDMAISTKNNPNENYAREIMQLFSIGLFMLNPDGTLQLDGSNNPIPTYDQTGVNNLTKVLTGWSLCNSTNPANCPNFLTGTNNYIDPLRLNVNNHDLTAKTLLTYPGSTTTNINACTGCTGNAIQTYADASMDQALENIFRHPNVGPFIGKILIQHLVTSDPTPAYVSRIATVFNNNGFGTRGDLKAVVRAILLDPEARGDKKTDPLYGKLREPVQLATNVLRQFNVRSANGSLQSDGAFVSNRAGTPGEFIGMAQIHFMSPTVFNFYPPEYVVPGTAFLGPEFAIMTTGTSIQRANFINRVVFSTFPIANPDYPNGTSIDLSEMQTLATIDVSGATLVDELNRRMMHSTMSATMRTQILTAVTALPSATANDFLARARQAVYLVATSSQYQVQR